MPAPSVDPGLSPAAGAAPARRTRWWPALGVVVAVLWLHGLLIAGLLPGRVAVVGRDAPAVRDRAAAPVQVRTITSPAPPAPVPLLVAPPRPVTLAPPAPAVVVRPAPGRAARAEVSAAAPAPAPASGPGVDAETLTPAARVGEAALDDTSAAAAVATAAGAPPPVYATRLPASVLLQYRLRRGAQSGEATLAWRQDGQRYQLQFDARAGAAGPALIEQRGQGGFDAAGLAPDRFTDRRRGRGQRAVNFRRDIGRIGFSGPQVDYPAWPGAQDSLSWLVQLVAIQAGAAAPLPLVALFVVDARGDAELWRFESRGEALVDTALGRVVAQHWLREPDRPEGQRVEIWLDPARGHWPVQIRTTVLRTGDRSELLLAAEPAAPP